MRRTALIPPNPFYRMKILNIGSVNIDMVYQVPHFVRPGETLSSTRFDRFPGGKGFNQSVALARAGARVAHVGCVGPDGLFLKDYLAREGTDVEDLAVLDGTPTGHAVIQVDASGQNCIILNPGANVRVSRDLIVRAFDRLSVGPGDIVLFQNETSAVADGIRLAAGRGAAVALNPAPMAPNVLEFPLDLVSLFVVNELEGAALAGLPADSAPSAVLDALRARFPKAAVLLTLGAEGSVYPAPGIPEPVVCPSRRVEAVDTTAAGDTFIGFFLAAGGSSAPSVSNALGLATRASAYCVSHAGAAPSIPRLAEIQ